MKDALDLPFEQYKDIMSASTNDIGFTKLIEMDKVTDPHSHLVASKPYTLLMQHHKYHVRQCSLLLCLIVLNV